MLSVKSNSLMLILKILEGIPASGGFRGEFWENDSKMVKSTPTPPPTHPPPPPQQGCAPFLKIPGSAPALYWPFKTI